MDSGKSGRKLGFKENGANKLLSIDQWLSAFLIYSSVYLQKFQSEYEAIFRYIETVRGLGKKGWKLAIL